MKNLILFLASIIILITFACNRKVGTEADVSAIKTLTESWDNAFNSGNADALVSLYTDDALRIPPNMIPVTGSDAIRDYFNTEFEQYSYYEIDDPVDEVIVLGNKAFVRGKFLLKYTLRLSDEQEKDEGNWIILLDRQPDGSWKFYYEIFNSE